MIPAYINVNRAHFPLETKSRQETYIQTVLNTFQQCERERRVTNQEIQK